MSCASSSQARKLYSRRVGIAIALYVVAILSCIYLLRYASPGPGIAVLHAIVPSLPILATLVAVGVYLRDETDEFQRFLFQQTLLWGIGITLAFTSVWGLLEMFTGTPHFPVFFTFQVFWFFVGTSQPFIRRQYQSSGSDA